MRSPPKEKGQEWNECMTEGILKIMKKRQQAMPKNEKEYRTLATEIKNKCRQAKKE